MGKIRCIQHTSESKDSLKNKKKKKKKNTKTRLCSDQCGCGPDDSFGSIRSLNSLADALHQRFEEAVDNYMEAVFQIECHNNSGIRKSLAHELAMIAIPFKSTEGVLNRCERNAKMAELFR